MRFTYAQKTKTKTKADQKPPGWTQTQTLETREQRPSLIAHIAIDSASRSTPARQLPADGRGSEMWIVWPAPTPALHYCIAHTHKPKRVLLQSPHGHECAGAVRRVHLPLASAQIEPPDQPA
eukprot:scaffold19380_cov107-Isochrysis_galbana.AAC.9